VPRDGTQSLAVSAAWDTPCRSPSKVGCVETRLLPFHAKAADQARVVYMPDTAWPVSGHPPDLSRNTPHAPVSMSPVSVTTLHQRFACARLPDPYLTPHNGAFSSSLTTTVFNQRSMRRFDASPRRATPKGHTLHLPRSTTSRSSAYTIKLLSMFGTHVGFQKPVTWAEQQLYTARSYSLIKPPSTCRRLIRSLVRSATGWVGRGGRSSRARCGRRPL
jgi:hypothetical protein